MGPRRHSTPIGEFHWRALVCSGSLFESFWLLIQDLMGKLKPTLAKNIGIPWGGFIPFPHFPCYVLSWVSTEGVCSLSLEWHGTCLPCTHLIPTHNSVKECRRPLWVVEELRLKQSCFQYSSSFSRIFSAGFTKQHPAVAGWKEVCISAWVTVECSVASWGWNLCYRTLRLQSSRTFHYCTITNNACNGASSEQNPSSVNDSSYFLFSFFLFSCLQWMIAAQTAL